MSAIFDDADARRDAARKAPVWSGDLGDDCSSRWAGFLLRAEKMKEGAWWYAVTDLSSGATIEDSNGVAASVADGVTSRRRCEEAVRRFLSIPSL
jgi:hypothetical protein